MTIGERIRNERKARGISMSELGKRIGVTAAAISRYELGQRELTLNNLERIANALGIHIFDLVDIGAKLDAISEEFEKEGFGFEIVPIAGKSEEVTPEKLDEIKKILESDVRCVYNGITDEQKRKFGDILAPEREPAILYNRKLTSSERINSAISQMTEEGLMRVADYAEDILPRYQRQQPAAPPPDAPETPPEGE